MKLLFENKDLALENRELEVEIISEMMNEHAINESVLTEAEDETKGKSSFKQKIVAFLEKIKELVKKLFLAIGNFVIEFVKKYDLRKNKIVNGIALINKKVESQGPEAVRDVNAAVLAADINIKFSEKNISKLSIPTLFQQEISRLKNSISSDDFSDKMVDTRERLQEKAGSELKDVRIQSLGHIRDLVKMSDDIIKGAKVTTKDFKEFSKQVQTDAKKVISKIKSSKDDKDIKKEQIEREKQEINNSKALVVLCKDSIKASTGLSFQIVTYAEQSLNEFGRFVKKHAS